MVRAVSIVLVVGFGLMGLAYESVFILEESQHAIVTQSGRPRGKTITRPGLHVKIPFIQKEHYIPLPAAPPSFENSLVLTPLYVGYLAEGAEEFRFEAAELQRRIGRGRYVMLGFAAFLDIAFPRIDLAEPVTREHLSRTLEDVDTIVRRARDNGLVTHISIVSGFFHGWNDLLESAVRQDVRNAQWFADGLIAPEEDLSDPAIVPRTVWITPSRYALPFRQRVEEGARILGAYLAREMAEFPDTLVTISGDAEVELTYERNFLGAGEHYSDRTDVIYADYSPFMVAEFRDWLREDYRGDLSPASDDNGDGRTLNGDFGRNFSTWSLRYYDESGAIPYDRYLEMPEKLPTSGALFIDGGFDAPRAAIPGDPFWETWLRFRKEAVANWVQDFAVWITSSPDPVSGFMIPASRYYSHQIPADFIFGESDNLRLTTSASFVETAILEPVGSPGITAFNGYDGNRHSMTATPELFSALFHSGDHWGVLEYNPSIPYANEISPSGDEDYYLDELHRLYAFRPHVIVPFAWTDFPHHRRFSIKDSAFERGLRRFVEEAGDTPWFSWRRQTNVGSSR